MVIIVVKNVVNRYIIKIDLIYVFVLVFCWVSDVIIKIKIKIGVIVFKVFINNLLRMLMKVYFGIKKFKVVLIIIFIMIFWINDNFWIVLIIYFMFF